ncbi:hypothetical protein EIN_131830, partial [Entamoeba invadens IP1]
VLFVHFTKKGSRLNRLWQSPRRCFVLDDNINPDIKEIVNVALQIADERVLICRSGVLLLQQEGTNFDEFCNRCSLFLEFNDSTSNSILCDNIKTFTQAIQNHDFNQMIQCTYIALHSIIGPAYHMMIAFVQIHTVLGKIILLTYREQHTKSYWMTVQRVDRYFQRFIGWVQLHGVLEGKQYEKSFSDIITNINTQISKRRLHSHDLKNFVKQFGLILHELFIKITFTLDDLLGMNERNQLVTGMKKLFPLILESDQFVNYMHENNLAHMVNPLEPFNACHTLLQSSPNEMDGKTLKLVKNHLKKLSESLSCIFRSFNVPSLSVNTCVDNTIKSLQDENITESYHNFTEFRRYMRLYPRMSLLVNTFYAIFDDTVTTHVQLTTLFNSLNSIQISLAKPLTPTNFVKKRERSRSDPLTPPISPKLQKSGTSMENDTNSFSFTNTIDKLEEFKDSFNALCYSHLNFCGYFVQTILNAVNMIRGLDDTRDTSVDKFSEVLGKIFTLGENIAWVSSPSKLCLVKYFGYTGAQFKALISQIKEYLQTVFKDLPDVVPKTLIHAVKEFALKTIQQLLFAFSFNLDVVGYLHNKIIKTQNYASGDAHITIHPTAVKVILETVGEKIGKAVYDILMYSPNSKIEIPVRYVLNVQKTMIDTGKGKLHKMVTNISSGLMTDQIALKSIVNKVHILVAIFVQCSPTEENLEMIQNYYHSAFKQMKGCQLVDERRGEKVRSIVQLVYSHISKNPNVMSDVKNETLEILSLAIWLCYFWKGYQNVIESNVAFQIVLTKLRFLFDVLTEAEFIKENREKVLKVLKVISLKLALMKDHPMTKKDFVLVSRDLVEVLCPLFTCIIVKQTTLLSNTDESLVVLQEIATNTDMERAFQLSVTFMSKLLLHIAMFVSEFRQENDQIIKFCEERVTNCLISSTILTNFVQTLSNTDNHTHRSHKVMSIINRIIENSVMMHKFRVLRKKRNITAFPMTFKPLTLPKPKNNFKVSPFFNELINALNKGNAKALFDAIKNFVEANPYASITFEELVQYEDDSTKIDKCIKRVELMSLFNRIICWVLMISHNFVNSDDVPLICLEFDSFMDCSETVAHSK